MHDATKKPQAPLRLWLAFTQEDFLSTWTGNRRSTAIKSRIAGEKSDLAVHVVHVCLTSL